MVSLRNRHTAFTRGVAASEVVGTDAEEEERIRSA